MSPEELTYYRKRALIERERAIEATGGMVDIHLELACLYDKLVELEKRPRPNLHIVDSTNAR